MAANQKTQLLKLGIGTAAVVAIAGTTGWIYQAQTPGQANGQTTAAGDQSSQGSFSFGSLFKEREHGDDKHHEEAEHSAQAVPQVVQPGQPSTQQPGTGTFQQRQPRNGSTLTAPGTTSSGRTRTRHS